MIVPYADLKGQYAALREEILAALDRVGSKAAFILGEEVQAFEREFAAYLGVKHCVAVNSGTSALHLALLGVGVQAGDEVITTPNTFIATAEAISYTGAKPVFVDIDPRTANLDPDKIAAAVTPRTRAILPVHLYGLAAEMDPILEIAAQYTNWPSSRTLARRTGHDTTASGWEASERGGIQLLSLEKSGRLWRRGRPYDQ